MDKVRLTLQRAADDPKVNDPAFQAELSAFSAALGAAGITYSQRGMMFDAVGVPGYPLPDYLLTLGPPVIAAAAGACGAWVQARFGRKVRLKIGDVEAEGRSVEEIESLLKLAAEFRDDDHGSVS